VDVDRDGQALRLVTLHFDGEMEPGEEKGTEKELKRWLEPIQFQFPLGRGRKREAEKRALTASRRHAVGLADSASA
jgi:hypothetical protein